MKMQKNNLLMSVVIVGLLVAYVCLDFKQQSNSAAESAAQSSSQKQPSTKHIAMDDGQQQIMQAYQQQRSDIQVQTQGTVKVILPDDNNGSRHQKMILELDNGLTVLIAHNIDLAPRIDELKKGDTVEFYGEYEYSAKGGVIHWTHHDPQGRHADGWLKHQGKMYQ